MGHRVLSLSLGSYVGHVGVVGFIRWAPRDGSVHSGPTRVRWVHSVSLDSFEWRLEVVRFIRGLSVHLGGGGGGGSSGSFGVARYIRGAPRSCRVHLVSFGSFEGRLVVFGSLVLCQFIQRALGFHSWGD